LSTNLIDMDRSLDIVPLRSFVAVADCGGFARAAEHLHLSQAGVSQHVRRLEAAAGVPLVERHGRGSRFTPEGERLLIAARELLDLHDRTLRSLTGSQRTLTVGSTEHAAARLLPTLSAALEEALDGVTIQYRIDRGSRLREGLDARQVDLALLLNADDAPGAVAVGSLGLIWCAAPGFVLPAPPAPVPVVAFAGRCELRRRALETLADHGVPAVVGTEANQLAGVQAAVGAGLGVALMAVDEPPAGLVAVSDLPVPDPLALHVVPREGLATDVVRVAVDALAGALAVPARGLVLIR
jgi:DNA-binding transcriptional LysR family regulator